MGNDRSPDWLTDKNWKPQYSEILLLHAEKHSGNEIAKIVGIGVNTVARVIKSTLFQEKLNRLQGRVDVRTEMKLTVTLGSRVEEARRIISEAAYAAAATMIQIAQDGGGGKIQFLACKDILDRSGLKPIEIVETRERVFSPEEVIHAKGVLDEAQAVITRLRTQPSPFIKTAPKPIDVGQESSATDKGSNGAPLKLATADSTP